MKLSDLVKIRRHLQTVFPSEYEQSLNQSLVSLVGGLHDEGPAANKTITEIKTAQEKINDQFSYIRFAINDYKEYIENCISNIEQEYFDCSEEIYKSSLHDDTDYILNRRKQSKSFANQENFELFTSRIGMYNSWKYPAIEIRPAFGEITDFIKGCDPLYLLDTNEDLFSEVKKNWSGVYQKRLRYYSFDETEENSLRELPNNQFGLILSVDYFNFKPMSVIEKFLNEFYVKLRPGGIVVFTYNNCDLPYAVRNVENKFCCYTPGRLVKPMAEKIGYKILKSFDQLDNISWLELCKPGEISTIRGGQTLGEICSFN